MKIYAVAALLMAFTLVGCGRVPAGHRGILVNMLGGERGVDARELGAG